MADLLHRSCSALPMAGEFVGKEGETPFGRRLEQALSVAGQADATVRREEGNIEMYHYDPNTALEELTEDANCRTRCMCGHDSAQAAVGG